MIVIQRTLNHTHKKKMLGRTLLLAKFVVKVLIFIKKPLKKKRELCIQNKWENLDKQSREEMQISL